MTVQTNLLGQEMKTPSGSIGIVVAVIATPTKVEVVTAEPSGILSLNSLFACRVVNPMQLPK